MSSVQYSRSGARPRLRGWRWTNRPTTRPEFLRLTRSPLQSRRIAKRRLRQAGHRSRTSASRSPGRSSTRPTASPAVPRSSSGRPIGSNAADRPIALAAGLAGTHHVAGVLDRPRPQQRQPVLLLERSAHPGGRDRQHLRAAGRPAAGTAPGTAGRSRSRNRLPRRRSRRPAGRIARRAMRVRLEESERVVQMHLVVGRRQRAVGRRRARVFCTRSSTGVKLPAAMAIPPNARTRPASPVANGPSSGSARRPGAVGSSTNSTRLPSGQHQQPRTAIGRRAARSPIRARFSAGSGPGSNCTDRDPHPALLLRFAAAVDGGVRCRARIRRRSTPSARARRRPSSGSRRPAPRRSSARPARPPDLVRRRVGGDRDPAPHLALDLDRVLDAVVDQIRRVGHRERAVGQEVAVAQPLPQFLGDVRGQRRGHQHQRLGHQPRRRRMPDLVTWLFSTISLAMAVLYCIAGQIGAHAVDRAVHQRRVSASGASSVTTSAPVSRRRRSATAAAGSAASRPRRGSARAGRCPAGPCPSRTSGRCRRRSGRTSRPA